MTIRSFLIITLALALLTRAAASFAAAGPQASELLDRLTNSSLSFTENKGQFPDHILYQAFVPNATIWVTKTGMQYQFTRMNDESINPIFAESPIPEDLKPKMISFDELIIATTLRGANKNAHAIPEGLLSGKSNYFLGNDSSKWVTNVPDYSSVMLQGIYPGVNVYYYGAGGKIEYDFSLAPGADPSLIQIEYEGTKSLAIAENGDLLIETNWSTITQHKPVVYQEQNGARIPLDVQYALIEPSVVGFTIPKNYNPALALVIDPVITYGTYIGGDDYDIGWSVAVDDCGNAFLGGYTNSASFPTTTGAYDETYNDLGNNFDIFVTKFNTRDSGSATRMYSTYIGGSNREGGSIYFGLDADNSGHAYVGSFTSSSNYPTTGGAYDASFNSDPDVVVTKLAEDGDALEYSTFIGGAGYENALAIAVDDSDYAYIHGFATNVIPGSYPTVNGFSSGDSTYGVTGVLIIVSKLSANGSSLLYSTTLGEGDYVNYPGYNFSVNDSGLAFITGRAGASFPMEDEYDNTRNSNDAYIAVLDTKASGAASLLYSTYFGGSGADEGTAIDVDANGFLYITGSTSSSSGFPLQRAYQTSKGTGTDMFLAKIDRTAGASGLLYSSYYGGLGNEEPYDLEIDDFNQPLVVGRTDSSGLPTVNPIIGSYSGGGRDMFIAHFEKAGGSDSLYPFFSSYLGGGGYDAAYSVAIGVDQTYYVAVKSNGDSLFTGSVLGYDKIINGDSDAVLIKIAPGPNGCQTGDVNDDGTIDRNDVTYLTAYIFYSGPAPVGTSGRINNCDNGYSIIDVNVLNAYVTSCTPMGCSSCP